METLRLYTVFHLNLAYSSIEDEWRREVVERCYWPLLDLAWRYRPGLGIEASGYTLEAIADIDPSWVDRLRELVDQDACEFIGSGFAQIIAPLAPAEVNAANLRLGHDCYQRLLGRRPRLALVNEQAFSAGLVEHYLGAGYEAIIMDWDNPARCHGEWAPEWRYLPQRACGPGEDAIPVIWSNTIFFQKFQRYIFGALELDDYLDYLRSHLCPGVRAFPLYTADAEIFDFTPAQLQVNGVRHPEGHWRRFERLLARLHEDSRFAFINPGRVLGFLDAPAAGNRLRLDCVEQPIPVKKQPRYNIGRWAVTGPADTEVNAACWRLYRAIRARGDSSDRDWRQLCYLWSSDFRTHVTDARWRSYRQRLAAALRACGGRATGGGGGERTLREPPAPASRPPQMPMACDDRYLTVTSSSWRIRLDHQKGLAIDGVWLGGEGAPRMCGTIAHGFYDDVSLGTDWHTGHLIFQAPGQSRVTDLCRVEPETSFNAEDGAVLVQAEMDTAMGRMEKLLRISIDEPRLDLTYRLHWKSIPPGSLRLGFLTLDPRAFDRSSLILRTENGGFQPEEWPLQGRVVEHGAQVSLSVSSRDALGMTGGWVEVGDARHRLRIEADHAASALIGLLSYRDAGPGFFCRLAFSAREYDETRFLDAGFSDILECRLSLRLMDVPRR